jgi:hypothetical protein
LTSRRCRSGSGAGTSTGCGINRIRVGNMNDVRCLGIKSADYSLLVVPWRFHATGRSALRTYWQVSGQVDSGADQSLLLSSPHPHDGRNRSFPSFPLSCSSFLRFSRSQRHTWRLGRATECFQRISRAAKWPTGAVRTGGPRRRWRRGSNAWDTTSAAKVWPTLSQGGVAWKITGSPASKRSLTSQSSSFSPRKFGIKPQNWPNILLRPCQIPIRPRKRNAVANAQS